MRKKRKNKRKKKKRKGEEKKDTHLSIDLAPSINSTSPDIRKRKTRRKKEQKY